MIFKDYYKILGFETNKVTIDDIKNAYREKAKKYHPDINVGDSSAEEIFKDINEAYKTLSNEKLRRKYDFNWNRYVGRKTTKKQEKRTIKEMLLDIFFGGITKKATPKQVTPKYGENINTKIDITIEEAFFGANKKLKFKTVDGKETSFSIKVPAGIQNNDKIRIPGQGKQGKNGGKNGDLLIYVNIKDNKNLKLVGSDLFIEIPLKDWEAALGTKKQIQVLKEDIQIVIPECTSSGEKLVIKGKGYKNGRGNRGDLYIVTKIILPKKMNSAQKQIYETLKSKGI